MNSMNKSDRSNSQSGITLVEVLVALTLISFFSVILVQLVNRAFLSAIQIESEVDHIADFQLLDTALRDNCEKVAIPYFEKNFEIELNDDGDYEIPYYLGDKNQLLLLSLIQSPSGIRVNEGFFPLPNYTRNNDTNDNNTITKTSSYQLEPLYREEDSVPIGMLLKDDTFELFYPFSSVAIYAP